MTERNAVVVTGHMINSAASGIQTGQYHDSNRLLSSALVACKNLLKLTREASPDERIQFDLGDLCCFRCSLSEMSSSKKFASGDSIIRRPSDDEDCFLFRASLQVNLQAATWAGSPKPDQVSTLTIAVVYNLALLEHLQALDKNLNQQMLQRALGLYRHAARLLGAHAPDQARFFKIVIANNMGHAYHCLQCPTLAHSCFRYLAFALAEHGVNATNFDGHGCEAHSGIIANAMMLFLISNTAAAA